MRQPLDSRMDTEDEDLPKPTERNTKRRAPEKCSPITNIYRNAVLKNFSKWLSAVFLSLTVSSASAQSLDAQSASTTELFQDLVASVNGSILICSMSARIILLGVSMGKVDPDRSAEQQSCIEKAKSKLQVKYTGLKPAMKDNKDAVDALNDYVATALSVFDDLRPRTGESSEERYGYRIDAAQSDLTKKANVVKLQLL